MKGLAGMKLEKGAAPAKPAPDSAKTAALKECIAALQDGDVDGAAEALGVAVQACMNAYGEEDNEE